MHRTLIAPVATLFIVVSAPSRADVGPPPSCPAGTHHAYYMGHRCVPDGSHLERDPNGGGVIFVKDGELAPTPKVTASPKPPPPMAPDDPLNPFPPPATSSSAAPSASASAAPAPVAPAPVASASAAPALAAPVAENSANPIASPPPQRGCTCGVPGAPEERMGFVMVIGAMLFAVSRRIRRNRAND